MADIFLDKAADSPVPILFGRHSSIGSVVLERAPWILKKKCQHFYISVLELHGK